MVDIEEMQDMLDMLADELPDELYEGLNGGILLLPDRKLSPEALDDDLFTLGEYHHSYSMGRYIVIYHGSFDAIFGHLPKEELLAELRKTLRHEFTHHLESLAGEKDLEIEDERQLARYRYRARLRQIKSLRKPLQ
ncbi:MAG: metallopeptidase family protein [Clostridiales Family XIII bacterium]|nr:metallopeptidase family protein [Clostridiales Family XIII bacterium]